MEYVLKTKELTKVFAGKNAVNKVNMNVHRGDIYGFIGENGAGKTTLMRMVCGLANPTGGSIELFGSKDLEAHRLYHRKSRHLPEYDGGRKSGNLPDTYGDTR